MDKGETRRSRAKIQDVREQRATATPFELREVSAGDYILEGYASTWDPYDCYGGVDAGGWVEQLDRRAFDATLRSNPDLQLLINHEGMPLARTKSGTLELSTDRTGLKVRAHLDPTDPDVQALLPKMRRGDMDEMSFAFRVKDQVWNDNYTHRNITEVSLQKGDVSVVNYGMNPTTKASIMVPGAVEALAHVGEREMAELRKMPDEELDNAMRAILRARGIHPPENIEWDILDRSSSFADRVARGMLTPEQVRALERAKSDDDKDKHPTDKPEHPTNKPSHPSNDDEPPQDDDEDDEKKGDDEPIAITQPYIADVPPVRGDDSKKPYGDVPYADPGYQDDKKKRYPIDTEAHARAAWNYINKASNQEQYSAEQVSQIKSKIRSALKKFGVDVDEKKAQIVEVALRGEDLIPVFVLDDGTEMAVAEETWAAYRNANGLSQRVRGSSNPANAGLLGTQRLNLDGDQGTALEPSQGVQKDEGDAQDNTTPGNTSAQAANDDVTFDCYCPECGEAHDDGQTCAEHQAAIEEQMNASVEGAMRTIGDQDPKDPKKKTPGKGEEDEEDDDEEDDKKRSIVDEILSGLDPLDAERAKAKDDKPYGEDDEDDEDEDDPRKRNYSLSRAMQELMDDKGEGPQDLRAAATALSEFRDYSEPEPEPEPQPEPEPEREPALSMQDAWRELRMGDDVFNLERAEEAAATDVDTPEVVERLMTPPEPEPEPEPEPPVDVRSELEKFLDEDRQRYSLEDALKRAAELGAQEIARNNPTTHQVDAGWDAIDNAGKQFLRKEDGAA
jgi:HK97 family phage prohead protease